MFLGDIQYRLSWNNKCCQHKGSKRLREGSKKAKKANKDLKRRAMRAGAYELTNKELPPEDTAIKQGKFFVSVFL